MSHYYGYIIGFLAMVCYASIAPLTKKVSAGGVDGFHLILLNTGLLVTFSIIVILLKGQSFNIYKEMSLSVWGWSIFWALINFVGFALFLEAVKNIQVADYQIMYLASPLVGALIAFFLLKEPLMFKHLIGGLFVMIGMYIIIRQ